MYSYCSGLDQFTTPISWFNGHTRLNYNAPKNQIASLLQKYQTFSLALTAMLGSCSFFAIHIFATYKLLVQVWRFGWLKCSELITNGEKKKVHMRSSTAVYTFVMCRGNSLHHSSFSTPSLTRVAVVKTFGCFHITRTRHCRRKLRTTLL